MSSFSVLLLQNGKMSGVDVLWPSDTCNAAHPTDSKGFDTDMKVIYDEDWTFEETIMCFFDEAELTETLPFECDSLAEEGEGVFKFKRGDIQRFESDLTITVFPIPVCRMRRNLWRALTAYRSKKDEDGYEFLDHVFKIATDENCKICGGGMIKDRVENLNGKTISVKCDRRQKATRIY